jgi:hypothetical protein
VLFLIIGVSLLREVQAGFHPPRYAAFLTSPSPSFAHSSEGIVHYHGDTLDGTSTITFRTTSPSGYTLTVESFSIRGRYLGPCNIK